MESDRDIPKSSLRGIIFDRDGTLFNSREVLYQTLLRVLITHGITLPSRAAHRVIDRTAANDREFWQAITKGAQASRCDWKDLEESFRKTARRFLHLATPRKGVTKTLRYLHQRGLIMGLVSALPGTRPTEALLERYGLSRYLRFVLTAYDPVNPRNVYRASHYQRKRLLVRRALEILKLPGSETAMVGDTPTDIRVGRAYGMYTVAILGGSSQERELLRARPDLLIRRFQQLAGRLV